MCQIYGFMRKVSLRHVEAEIIDPDASTWCEWLGSTCCLPRHNLDRA